MIYPSLATLDAVSLSAQALLEVRWTRCSGADSTFGNVHKWCLIFWGHFWPLLPPPSSKCPIFFPLMSDFWGSFQTPPPPPLKPDIIYWRSLCISNNVLSLEQSRIHPISTTNFIRRCIFKTHWDPILR